MYDQNRILDAARNVLRQESTAIAIQADTLDLSFCQAFSFLLKCSGNVIVSGMGKAGLIGQKIAATFASTGTPAHFLHPAEAIHGDLGRIRKDDVVLILSNSGETDEILRIIPSLKECGTPIIAITKNQSSLARCSDAVLTIAVQNEAGPLNLAPSNSTAVMLALGDALAFAVSGIRSFREEDFARVHPGGMLGMKLKPVETYMRPRSSCRIVKVGKTVHLERFKWIAVFLYNQYCNNMTLAAIHFYIKADLRFSWFFRFNINRYFPAVIRFLYNGNFRITAF